MRDEQSTRQTLCLRFLVVMYLYSSALIYLYIRIIVSTALSLSSTSEMI